MPTRFHIRLACRLAFVVALAALVLGLPARRAAAAPDGEARAPRLVLSPAAVTFRGAGETVAVTLSNVGGAPLHVGGVRVVVSGGRGSTDFFVDAPGAREIAPGGTVVLNVSFRPASGVPPPQVFGALLIIADDPALPLDIDLPGGGAAPQENRVSSVALRAGPSRLLSWLIFFPLLGIPLLFLVPSGRERAVRWVASLVAAVPLGLAALMAVRFDPTYGAADGNFGLQLVEHVPWIRALGAEYFVAIDGLSVTLVVLATLLAWVAITASSSARLDRQARGYFAMLLLLEVGMTGVFCALDAVLFYAFWAVMLVPLYFLVGVWGGPRREQAATKAFLFAVSGAFLILFGIIALHQASAPTYLIDGRPAPHTFDVVKLGQMSDLLRSSSPDAWSPGSLGRVGLTQLAWLALFVGFSISVPVVPLHGWLLEVCAEAPAAVSAVLVGAALKTGIYGMLRFNWAILPGESRWAAGVVASLGVASAIYGALCAMAETDLRRLVAYASISSLGFCLLGMAAQTPSGLSGAVMQMFSHGLVAATLFLLVGALAERTQETAISSMGGLAGVMPRYAVLFGLGFMASLGLPGLSGFVGQALVLLGSFGRFPFITLLALLAMLLTAAVHLWTIQRVQLGPVSERWGVSLAGRDLGARELVPLLPLVALIIALGVYPAPVLETIASSIADLARRMPGSP
jgi:NADH-quinone oxidoreductase subunit M